MPCAAAGVPRCAAAARAQVLEGIGLIEKKSKNNIQWNTKGMGLTTSGELKGELDGLKQTIVQLQGQEMMLDDYILLMQVRARRCAAACRTDCAEHAAPTASTYGLSMRSPWALPHRRACALASAARAPAAGGSRLSCERAVPPSPSPRCARRLRAEHAARALGGRGERAVRLLLAR